MNKSLSPKSGIDCFLNGLSLIRQPGLRQYVIVPTMINILVLVLLVAWGTSKFGELTEYLAASLPDWLAFLSGLFAFLAAVLAVIVLLYLFTIIANLIASPFNAVLSIRVEEHLTGKTPGADEGLLHMLVRSTGRELQKLGYLLPRMLGLVVITLIPGVNALAPFLWIGFGAWMMALQYTDYAADNNGISFRELRRMLGKRKTDALLFGALAYAVLAIPIVNLILIPAAVAGGTSLFVHQLNRGARPT